MSQTPPPDPAGRPETDGGSRRPSVDIGKRTSGESVDQTQEIPPMSSGRDPYAAPPQAGPAGGPPPGAPRGWQPGPPPQYGPPGMASTGAPVKIYGPVLPALGAGIVTGGLVFGLGALAMTLLRQGSDVLAILGQVAAFFDVRSLQVRMDISTSHALFAGIVAGIVVLVLTLLAGLTTRRSGARGLLFFAVWGISGLGAVVASLVVGVTVGHFDLDYVGFIRMVNPAGGWGFLFGWIPALIAVALRFGRQRTPVAPAPGPR